MKSKRYDATDARRVHIGLITDSVVANRVASMWQPEGLFASKWENHIAGLVVDYARKYGKAPGREIETMFTATADRLGDEDIRAVETLLGSLSDEYERNGHAESSEYILDLAGRVFTRVRQRRLAEAITESLDAGEDAGEVIAGYRHPALSRGSFDNPKSEYQFWLDAYESGDERPIITFPGDLGKFIGDEFCRDSLVMFLAPEKRGKSWWLLETAVRAMKQGRRVALFSVGDMSRRQMGRRLGRRLTRLPKFAGTYKVPIKFGDEFPEHEERDFPGISPEAAYAACAKVCGPCGDLRLGCYPNSTASVADLATTMKDWANDGWVVDVVVIDYADILAPPAGVREHRDQINTNWMHLRRLSQELHACVVTATQADAASYDKKLLTMANFSEDKRKWAHVTAGLGINQIPDEKKMGMSRISKLAVREADSSAMNFVRVAGNLDLACPVMISSF